MFFSKTDKEQRMFILIHLFFPFVSFKGHGILKRHSIKRNLGGAGNHQVIEATPEGRKDREIKPWAFGVGALTPRL